MKKILKKYIFHIIMFIIILVLFIILKNIELTNECTCNVQCIKAPCPCICTYDVFAFSTLKTLKSPIVPFILVIYFVLEVIKLIFNLYKSKSIKREIIYSLLILIVIYLFDCITSMSLNTIFV